MGYTKLFWGFLFLFDFRINGFDILPDIIGFILIYQGLTLLLDRDSHFESARKIALPMIFISIFDIYQRQVNLNYMDFMSAIYILIGLILGIVILIMVYNILTGIAGQAKEAGLTALEELAQSRWQLYKWVMIITMAAPLFIMIIPGLGLLLIPLVIISFISYILVMGLLKKAEENLGS